jgi:DNA-binding XRE family transcriptional regulator
MADPEIQAARSPTGVLGTLFLNLGFKVAIAGDEMIREEFIALRKSLHLTQEEIAKALGVHVQTVKRAEGKERAGKPIPAPLNDRLELALIKGLLRLKKENG